VESGEAAARTAKRVSLLAAIILTNLPADKICFNACLSLLLAAQELPKQFDSAIIEL
jgi:hypothetical protein